MQQLECDAILFDLDGVLVDSTQCIERHWRRWAEKRGLDVEDVIRRAHGKRTVETVREFAPHLPAEAEAARLAAGEAFDTEGIIRIEGAAELLQSIPDGRWAVATSGTRDTATTRLTCTGLPVPAVLITAHDVKEGKPHPEPYLAAAERLGVAPGQCVVVEDAPAGIQSARAAGMRVIAVVATHSRADLANADALVERLTDIRVSVNGEQSSSRLAIGLDGI